MSTAWDGYSGAAARLIEPVAPNRDHILGPSNAPVTLVEYGDYQCPYCGQAHLIVAEVLRAEPEVRYVFRHFPLTTVHPRAEPAAEASECASTQGAFWPMHNLLYSHQDALDDEDLLAYARYLELDEQRFVQDLVGREYAHRVRADFLSGARSGVNGTPTFFINDVRYDGSYALPRLVAAVQAAAKVGARR
jgi:protein-disulfide isomerase